jgi:NTP pyrophosphatase (non-canonical NTP hydrolase)
MSNDLSVTIEKIKKFRDDRDWMQFHDHKNMAISIIIEATELLEHFQWKNRAETEEFVVKNRDSVEEEIADIAIYLFELADNLGIDLLDAMNRKIEKNDQKYPVEKAKGNAKKYNQL